MKDDPTHPPATELRRNSLGLGDLIFQGVTHIGPAGGVVFTFPVIALKAGPTMPLSLLLVMVICFFIANTVSEFSKYMPSSGGYYSFATRGLGSRVGFLATWSFLTYDILGPAGCSGFLGYLLSDIFLKQFGWHVGWWLIALVSFGIVWFLTIYGIQISSRVTALLGGIELLVMSALAVTFLLHPGPGSNYLSPLNPSSSPHHLAGILAGMVFAVLALSGFEGPAPLAQEARLPASSVSKAILLSLVAIGVFYIFAAYATVVGWGSGNMTAFSAAANPYYDLGRRVWGSAWWLVIVALVNSSIGVGLACTNASSRVLYTMGRSGILPRAFGRIHAKYKTPAFSISMIQVIGIVAVLTVGFTFRPEDIFGFLETIAALAVIVLYAAANIALTAYMLREHRDRLSPWRHIVLPALGTLALIPVLIVTVYPIQTWPYSLAPYLYCGLLFTGVVYMAWLQRGGSSALQKGAAMLELPAQEI